MAGFQESKSVIYTCFGSLSWISTNQMKEIAVGLESSKQCFVWVVPKANRVEKWFEEENYEERVRERGVIIRGWAPQVLILSHQSVGAFMTALQLELHPGSHKRRFADDHMADVSEQFFNENFVVDVVKTGVRVGAEACVKDEKSLVKWDQVRKAIIKVMMEEGNERRMRAKRLGEMAIS